MLEYLLLFFLNTVLTSVSYCYVRQVIIMPTIIGIYIRLGQTIIFCSFTITYLIDNSIVFFLISYDALMQK